MIFTQSALGLLVTAGPVIAEEAPPGPDALAPFSTAFAQADLNSDGGLSIAEAKRGGFLTGESFEKTDDDRDGTVTLFELGKALTQSTESWLDEHDEHDKDDDGHVDKNEAVFGSRIFTVFDRIDTNQDERLNRQEIRAFATQSYYSETAAYPIAPNIIDKKF